MKIKELVIISALGFAACCSGSSAFAQENSKPTIGEAASAGVRASPPKIERITTLSILAGNLSEAVEVVQDQSPEPMNIVLGDAGTLTVPALTLRNVTGPDALMLIAAAANVNVKPISGVDGNTIGFAFQIPESLPGGKSATEPQTSDPYSHTRKPSHHPAHVSPDAAGSTDATPSFGGGQVRTFGDDRPRGISSFGGGGGFGGGAGRGAGAGAYAAGGGRGILEAVEDSAVNTRVYPLAEITTSIKFDEVEETLRDLLKTEGIAAEAAKFAFHQKTGVLVLRGPEEVHRLVQELLRALEQNTTQAREKNATRDLTHMQVKIDSLTRELNRLEKRSEEAEAVARKYQNELLKLQNSQQDKR